ncbi:FUSC family protein [Pseudopedobacter beijingensis]|uniref:FUSC family membrane protein n=1 Tax=Pseudopedobacter beijingensis TaxID=1207056 RepID=A0ABW4ID24_9SPHI
MFKQIDDFRDFLYTQYFSDGIKITIGVLLPSVLFFQLDYIEIGMTISLGAVCCSMVDTPGPWLHRRNAMLITNGLVCLVALLTSLINNNIYLTGIEVLVFGFLFSMFGIYGNRASSVGIAALFIMILNLEHQHMSLPYFQHALFLLAGGFWYFILSMSFSAMMPHRYAQQTLGECIQEIGRYMKLRANFYDYNISVEDNFKKLVEKQVVVNNLQDNVREILFKTRELVKDSTPTGRMLIVVFADMVDLFEQTMATHNDYEVIRERYKGEDILPEFASIIKRIATEIEYLGSCLIYGTQPRKHIVSTEDLDLLKDKINKLETKGVPVRILRKIFINLRHIHNRTGIIFNYFENKNVNDHNAIRSDHSKFVVKQSFDFKLLKNNINLKSGYFRYALRFSIVAFIGFIIGKLLPLGNHSYWIVLTIMVILKPGFSITKTRNYQRMVGTIIGGIAGALILYLIPNQNARFVIMVLFMITSYSTQRVYYFVSVLFMTPFILIMFSFISTNASQNIIFERVLDTAIGSVIALVSSYIIFPSWESYQIKEYMADMLKANLDYLEVISKRLAGENIEITDYKLARKAVYVNTANLAAAFQRMLSEPKNKQAHATEVHRFVVLSHVLSSYLANLSSNIGDNETTLGQDQKRLLNKASYYLKKSNGLINKEEEPKSEESVKALSMDLDKLSDTLITEQLELITKVSADIYKVTEEISSN